MATESRQLDLILKVKDLATKQLKNFGGALNSVGGSVKRSLGSILNLKNALIGLATGALVSKVYEYANSIQNVNNKLIAVTGSQEMANKQFERLFDIAQRSRGDLEAIVSGFARFDLANKQLGGTTAETEMIIETLTKGLNLYGATAGEVGSVMLQLSQAFGSNVLQGEEFRALAENFPPLMTQLAKELKVTRGELKQMGADGEITGDIIKSALTSMADDINAKFEEMPVTVGQAMTMLKNTFFAVMKEVNDKTGIFDSMAETVANFTKWVMDNRTEIVYWATIIIGAFKTVGKTIWNVMQIIGRIVKNGIDSMISMLGTAGRLLVAVFSGNFSEIGGIVDGYKNDMLSNSADVTSGLMTDFNDIGTAWKDQMDLPNKFYETSKASNAASQGISGMGTAFKKTSKEAIAFTKKLSKLFDAQKKKIKSVKQDIKDLKKEFKEDEKDAAQDLATNVAQVIVDKEDELAEARSALAEADTEEKKTELKQQINDLENFLSKHSSDIAENQNQIAEVRRQAGLDEIERLKEEHAVAKAERLKDYEEKRSELKDHLKEVKKEYKKALKELKEEISEAGLDYISIRSEIKGKSGGGGDEGKKLKGGNKKKGKAAHFAKGTDSIPMDGFAFLHKDEKVIPADKQGSPYNGGSGNQPINNTFIFKDSVVTSQRDLEDMIDKIMRKKQSLAV